MITWMEVFHQKLHHWWIAGMKMIPNLLLAVIFWILFFLMAKFFRKSADKLTHHFSGSKAVSRLLPNLIYLMVILTGLYVGLNVLKLDKIAISLLAGAGIVGLTLAFAFQDLTANFISGIYIDFNKPFDIGDVIESNNMTGIVEEIGLRSTTIRTLDGLHILVPNKNIFQNPITNYSKTKGKKITINFSISIQESMDQIEHIIVDAVGRIRGIDHEKETALYFTDFDQAKLKVSVIFWIKNPGLSGSMATKHVAILAIIQALHDNHIER